MLASVFIVSLITRLAVVSFPQQVWWDGAIYVGMGKMIFSGGTMGLWEPFRPVVWPFILGFLWKIGLDPYTAGVFIVVASSLGALYIIYLIGERIRPQSGIFAATLFSFTPTFLGLTAIPLTDIPALFLGLLALEFFLSERLLLSGIALSLSFLFRFPLAILFVPCAFLVGATLLKEHRPKPAIQYIIGLMPLTFVYFIISLILYRDPLFTIKAGNAVAAGSHGPYDTHPFFYLTNTLMENPLYIFFFVFLWTWIQNWLTWFKNKAAFITLASTVLLFGYFSFFPHKEPRYALAFLPFVAIGAGYGIATFLDKITIRYIKQIVLFGTMGVLLILALLYSRPYWLQPSISPSKFDFYTYFKNVPLTRIVGTSPQMTVYSNVMFVGLDDTWEGIYDEYKDHPEALYIALDTCQLVCNTPQCAQAQARLRQALSSHSKNVFNKTESLCSYEIYKLNQ